MKTYKHGGDVYSYDVDFDFSANINPLGMPESVRRAVEQSIADCVNYPDPYCRELTAGIAKKENVKEQNILCGNGAADLIFRFVLAKRPKKALILAPSFSEYEGALAVGNCEVYYYTLSNQNGFRLTEEFLNEITEQIDVVILCNPNNPTGRLIEMSLLEKIAQKCHDTNTFLFLDECFLDFMSEGEQRSMKKHISHNSNLLILKAFTKMYAIPGLRLGYCICSDTNLIEKMRASSQSWAVSIPAQAAGVAALKENDFVQKTVSLIREEQQYIASELRSMGILCYPPSANYIFFKEEQGIYERLLKKGILIRSCHNYPGLCHGYFRIAVKSHEQNIMLINAMKEVIKEGSAYGKNNYDTRNNV